MPLLVFLSVLKFTCPQLISQDLITAFMTLSANVFVSNVIVKLVC